jgi:hypothetical protein
MISDKEKVWKKLANKGLIMGPRIKDDIPNLNDEVAEMIVALKDKLDDDFTVLDIKHVINPSTFQPFSIIQLIKTEKK